MKAATFEGMAVDGLVTDRLEDFHRAVAAAGVGMTTLAYLAVSPDGGFKLFGKRFLASYPFEEAYFLPYARQFREAL